VSTAPPPCPQSPGPLAPTARPSAPSRPRAAVVSGSIWIAACLAGAFGLLTAVADLAGLEARLAATAAASDPGASAGLIDDGVRVTVLLVLGGAALLVVACAVWTVFLALRRPWARWALVVTGLLTVVAADVAQDLVTGGSDLDRIAFLAQAALALLALGTLFLPSLRAWLRNPGS
jgi:hypothetical protein